MLFATDDADSSLGFYFLTGHHRPHGRDLTVFPILFHARLQMIVVVVPKSALTTLAAGSRGHA
jgi:hypothetical protein